MWSDHVIADLGDDTCLLQIDRLFLHDMSGSSALLGLEASGRRPDSVRQVFTTSDHLITSRPGRGVSESMAPGGSELIDTTRRLSREYGFSFFDVGDPRQGIVHVVSPELGIALPGLTLVCCDSHTCTVGGVGTLGWGVGLSECQHVLATQTLTQRKPKAMRIAFDGRLPRGVYPKDVILHLIGRIGANGGIDSAVEFTGSAIRELPVEGRLTICNMAIEFSAKYGFVAPDDVTFEYLHGRDFAPKEQAWEAALASWKQLSSDEDALFDTDIAVDVSDIAPQVTWGTSPQYVAPVSGAIPDPAEFADAGSRSMAERALEYMRLRPGTSIAGIPIDAFFIGSCTNSRLSDLREAAAILDGRKVAEGVTAICVPGSTQVKAAAEAEGLDRIFKSAGFEWHESACGMCAAVGVGPFEDRRVLSTTNRNFEGRQGAKTRTHLASPATVAASALCGRITDVRQLMS